MEKVCKACQGRVKTWRGSDPKCAFTEEFFSNDNYRCVTVIKIRDLVHQHQSELPEGIQTHYTNSEQRYSTIDTTVIDFEKPDEERPVCLWIGWYKSRGRTEGMWLMFENIPPRPPTEEECIRILKYYEDKKG
jgi:hypothetical protein